MGKHEKSAESMHDRMTRARAPQAEPRKKVRHAGAHEGDPKVASNSTASVDSRYSSRRKIGYSLITGDPEDQHVAATYFAEHNVAPDHLFTDVSPVALKRSGLTAMQQELGPGDLLVVPALDRLAISLGEAFQIVNHLAIDDIVLLLDGQYYDFSIKQGIGDVFLSTLNMAAGFEHGSRFCATTDVDTL